MGLSVWARNRLRGNRGERYAQSGDDRNNRQRQQGPAIHKPDKESLSGKDATNEGDERTPRQDTPSNKVIAFFTALLFVSSLLQWARLGDQISSSEKIAGSSAKDTQASLKIAKRAAVAAETQSRETQRQSIATAAALKISAHEAQAITDQAKSARIEAAALQGQLDELRKGAIAIKTEDFEGFAVGKRPFSGLTIENVGHVEVKIATYWETNAVHPTEPVDWRSVEDKRHFRWRATLPIGGHLTLPFVFRGVLNEGEFSLIRNDVYALRLVGDVAFTDATKVTKHERFCWQWFGPWPEGEKPIAEHCQTE